MSVSVKALRFGYKPGDEVLCGIDIEVGRGEFVAVLGHNGSGKSTFAKHINVLLRPVSGEVLVNGLDTASDENIWRIRRSAGMVFQNPDNQIIATIVEDDVAFGPENLCIEQSEIQRLVDDALESIGLSALRDRQPHMLSGGQKQRVAIAGVLAMRPSIIVLDEPTAMLDPIGRREVLETISHLNEDEGITMILITHYMEEAVKAGRVIVMEEGKVVMQGTPREVFSRGEQLRALGLELPQATDIATRLVSMGVDISTNILTIDELVDEICCLKP